MSGLGLRGHGPGDGTGPEDTPASAAYRRATEAVGLYGDPDTTWAIALDLEFAAGIDVAGAAPRLEATVRAYPHLGAAPQVLRCPADAWSERRCRLATAPFRPEEPLVRVLVDDAGRRLLVVAHHGVCDGLGLVALAQVVSGVSLRPLAAGIGDRSGRRSFLLGSALRLGEALFRPPARFDGTASSAPGENLESVAVPRDRLRTGILAWAVAQTHRAWSRRKGGRLVVLVGASRRAPHAVAPDRQTAYLRFVVDSRWSRETTQERFAALEPEPDFPETSAGGLGPKVIRLLRNRLGGTALVSNLGIIEGDGLERVTFFPAISGPQAVVIGAATTGRWTVLTARTRAAEFDRDETTRLLGQVLGLALGRRAG